MFIKTRIKITKWFHGRWLVETIFHFSIITKSETFRARFFKLYYWVKLTEFERDKRYFPPLSNLHYLRLNLSYNYLGSSELLKNLK